MQNSSFNLPESEWEEPPLPAPRPHARRWIDKFAEALRGLKLGIRGQSSFFVHFFFAALVIVSAICLDCSLLEWCFLIGCIGGVLTAELFNSALESLFHGLEPEVKARLVGVLDISAGAALLASLTAVIIGGLIFTHRLVIVFGESSNLRGG